MTNPFRNSQLIQLTLAQFRDMIREPAVLFWGIVFPILMSLGLGVAFTQKKDVIHNIAVVAPVSPMLDSLLREHGEMSTNHQATWKLTLYNPKLGNTIFLFHDTTWVKAMVMLKRGEVNLILTDSAQHIRYHFDPLNPDAQLSYLKLSNLVENHDLLQPEHEDDISPLRVTGTRYIDFFVPGLIALGVITSCMWGISYTIIERRAKKLLRRMVATPMRKSNFLIAMMTVRIGMNFVEAGLLFLFSVLVFSITVQGSLTALLGLFICGNIAFTGIAIFISSNTSKTEIGNGLINAVTMPMMVLSGIFFSYHNFPEWAIGFIKALPLTMMADGIRAIFNEGAGWREVSFPSLVLLGTGILFFLAGLKVFKWH